VDNTLNYLDTPIHRTPTKWKTSIYRKPTFTDTINPYTSNHPTQNKYAAIKFLYNRLNSCDLHREKYQPEENIIHNILYNNSFPFKPQKPPYYKPKQQQISQSPIHRRTNFTYVGKETTCITIIFRHADLRIGFRTGNTIHNLLVHKNQKPDKFSLSGVYKLTCPDFKKAYVGQTGRNFTTRYNEHKHAFRSNSHTSSFAQHLNEYAYLFGTINNTMQILQYHKKGAHLNTLEWYYIHAGYASNNHLNDSNTIFPNAIFDTLLQTHHP